MKINDIISSTADSTNPTANTDSTNPSINPNNNDHQDSVSEDSQDDSDSDNTENSVSEEESDNPYKSQHNKLERSSVRISAASGKLFSEIDNLSKSMNPQEIQQINHIQDTSERRIENMEKIRDKLRAKSDNDTSRETSDPVADKKILGMEDKISRAEADAVYKADKVIEGINLSETERSSYNTILSGLKSLMSLRETRSEEHSKYLDHKIKQEQSTQSAEQEAPESSKRKRDDSEESQEPVDKKQKPDSLIGDFADPSQEFPGYTDGDD